ncbi:MAG: hypothetical protein JSV69_09075 [Chloroflexota bacterium]|jgi:hypothetical protein|nr:MAG: hypothetical protein JSV69_09075 [Chloroflexota bacterium]UCF28415.1 MAG: hypothetical protein JSW42_01640 [Chloroflexota bacterium]
MTRQPLFSGLVFDENDNPVDVTYVGGEPFYVVDDDGFLRHIPSEQVDRQVLEAMRELISGHEDALSEQTAKMLGQEDIFTRAMIESQLKNIDKQFDALFEAGIPEEGRAYMGMMGFRITIDIHGKVLNVDQPGMIYPEDE